jgi:hypothetical protein
MPTPYLSLSVSHSFGVHNITNRLAGWGKKREREREAGNRAQVERAEEAQGEPARIAPYLRSFKRNYYKTQKTYRLVVR